MPRGAGPMVRHKIPAAAELTVIDSFRYLLAVLFVGLVAPRFSPSTLWAPALTAGMHVNGTSGGDIGGWKLLQRRRRVGNMPSNDRRSQAKLNGAGAPGKRGQTRKGDKV